ncbi:helix-turn-helix domain-containing protein [Micromonospora okii]|uniref:helix-turn-helix domain-containing protein n=1 Tax=Micromonospora okii TaxID=1182970 RepID=UPI001E542C6C|nr:helix-turn-helix domain-containing protein [Micromonospora okii]
MDRSDLPVGRRVAYWRARRRLSQQVFADRVGKSKSWVDKVERGVRALDKVSTLHEIAAVLRIDPAVLLGRDARPADVTTRAEGVERVRAALSAYETVVGVSGAAHLPRLPPERLAQEVAHAWTTFQHARYPQVVALVPGVLADAQRCHADVPGAGRAPLVEAYRIVAALLVKLGEAELGWLAADRAMAVAAGDPVLVAAAAVQLGQALRASGRARAAMSAALAAAYRIAPPVPDAAGPAELSLCGTLLAQAALAAARDGDEHSTADLLGEAAELAGRVGEGHDHHRTAFGPTAVDLARVAAALDLGDAGGAVGWHERTVRRDAWRWLPAEHRAAHLLDAARAYLAADDPAGAGRAVLDAERTAPAEVRHRPAARELLARLTRDPHAPARIVQLAAALGAA